MRSLLLALLITPLMTPPALPASPPEGAGDMLDRVLGLTVIQDVEIAPDGRHAAFTTFENNFEDDRDMRQLWVVAVAGGEPRQLTRGEHSVGGFWWTARPGWLAFERDDDLHVINIGGGEARQVDLGIEGADNVVFSRDGGTVYFLAEEGEGTETGRKLEARKDAFGDYEVVREDGAYRHLWRQRLDADFVAEGEPEQLTRGREFTVVDFSLSPDDRTIAFVTWPSPYIADLLGGRLYLLSTEQGEAELLDEHPGFKMAPVWHPSGRRFAYVNGPGFAEYGDIVVVDEPWQGTRRVLDMPELDPRLLRFDDRGIFFSAGRGTRLGLYRADSDSGRTEALSADQPFVFDISFSRDGSRYAYRKASQETLDEVIIADGGQHRTLTDFSTQLAGMSLPSKKLIHWTNDVGQDIEGVLTFPGNYDPTRRYPLFVRTHGGPTGTDRPWMVNIARGIYQPEVLAAQGDGALVLQTNYRGSASYGEAFQTSNRRKLGIGPAEDIIAGVKQLVSDGLVDPDRVACLGWSQGGHISAMLSTYSDICATAIMGAGISDWRTYYYNTDITQFTTQYLEATPLADDAVYAETSPVTYIDRASTPVLIQHGENDRRVPIANGYQFRQLLVDRGIDTRMIVYADMGHGPSKPRTRRAITRHALMWTQEYLFAAEEAAFVFPFPPKDDEGGDEEAPPPPIGS